MIDLTLRIFGKPKAQPRARARKFGAHASVYDPGTSDHWKYLVAMAAKAHPDFPPEPFDVPLRVDIALFFPRPQRLLRKKSPEAPIPYDKKPDRDNSDKAILDALTQVGLWRDDALVCQGEPQKWYAAKDGRTGAAIRVTDALRTEPILRLTDTLL